jgi:hypothetical protein
MSREQHLMPSAERAERVRQKQRAVLRFLRAEIWTDHKNLGELLQVMPTATYRTVDNLAKTELLRTERVALVGGHITLIGITHHGQALAADLGEAVIEKVFVPSRVSATYLRHTLDVQLLRIKSERAGWSNWINADRVEKWPEGQARPDAFVVDRAGRRIAVECERTFKSPRRYNQILNVWLQSIRRGEVQRVVWVSPDDAIRDRLRDIITSVTHVEVAGQKVLIPHDRFENLDFLTYAEWPKS